MRYGKKAIWITGILILLLSGAGIAAHFLKQAPKEGDELIGTKAKPWGEKIWINSEPLDLDDLKGKVVLIRWWTDICPFCAASSDALNIFQDEFETRGLQLIGMYHPKPRHTKVPESYVRKSAKSLGFEFPIAIDQDWSALSTYWLDNKNRPYTSVSFILDKQGIIRYIHPGPEFHPEGTGKHKQCVKDYEEIKAVIEKLLLS